MRAHVEAPERLVDHEQRPRVEVHLRLVDRPVQLAPERHAVELVGG
jgi:hypothetical protein